GNLSAWFRAPGWKSLFADFTRWRENVSWAHDRSDATESLLQEGLKSMRRLIATLLADHRLSAVFPRIVSATHRVYALIYHGPICRMVQCRDVRTVAVGLEE